MLSPECKPNKEEKSTLYSASRRKYTRRTHRRGDFRECTLLHLPFGVKISIGVRSVTKKKRIEGENYERERDDGGGGGGSDDAVEEKKGMRKKTEEEEKKKSS